MVPLNYYVVEYLTVPGWARAIFSFRFWPKANVKFVHFDLA